MEATSLKLPSVWGRTNYPVGSISSYSCEKKPLIYLDHVGLSCVPRIINMLAHQSLLIAAKSKERKVDRQHGRLAIQRAEATEIASKRIAMDWFEKLTRRCVSLMWVQSRLSRELPRL